MPDGKARRAFVTRTLICLYLLVPMACVENGAMAPEREAVSGDLISVRIGDIRRSEGETGRWLFPVYLTNNTNHYLLIYDMWSPPDYGFIWSLIAKGAKKGWGHAYNLGIPQWCPNKCFLLEPHETIWGDISFNVSPSATLARDADEENRPIKFHIEQKFWVRAVLSKEDLLNYKFIEFQEDRDLCWEYFSKQP